MDEAVTVSRIEALRTPEALAFIDRHRTENVRDLALHAKRDGTLDMPWVLDQISGWQTARTKLPHWSQCKGIVYPPHLSMEQCSSQQTAIYKANLAERLTKGIDGGLVDLTGGLGVDFSYMARVFSHAVYVERQQHLCDIALHNMRALGLAQAQIVHADGVSYLRDMSSASMIFIDPARRDSHGARTYAIEDCTPNVLALKDELLGKAPKVMVKLSPMLDWRKTVKDFAGAVSEVHIIAVSNECKELLLVLTRKTTEAPHVYCVNDDQRLDFHWNAGFTTEHGENAAVDQTDAVSDNMVKAGAENRSGSSRIEHLYEPNAAVMKAGCFNIIEQMFGVRQVADNSHLYVSDTKVSGFPGRAFVVNAITTMNKKELKRALAGVDKANITVRNFPLSVLQLRSKLKLRDGGDTYLFATTLADGTHVIMRTRKES